MIDGQIPDPPAWLLPAAVEIWKDIAPKLAEVLHELDRVALAKYCQCYARYIDAETWMAEHGTTMTLRNDKGEVKSVAAVPHLGISVKMLAEMRHYEKQFGLTPLARSTNLQTLTETITDEELRRLAAEVDA
jgi:P27 family predicted phage terminase small subunit